MSQISKGAVPSRQVQQQQQDAVVVLVVPRREEHLQPMQLKAGGAPPADAAEGPPIAQQLNEATVSLEMFSHFVSSKVQEIEVEEELKAALQIFELPNRPGHIQLSTLRTAVTSWGDRLSSDEVEEMIKDADASEDGIVVIEDFIRSIMLR
ncbi:Hypothetical protein, putative [Bodo saltans]|uniref:Calmodulin n=1 Tax=Bodo saltans TaxID=75058 RepID=A0A0S4JMR2_BODSA|nr:Hypothetical protein, putative [Bodo saltans]|eukprot:CUG90692.1 Hypothetical protein, putative [Bodo saltans]